MPSQKAGNGKDNNREEGDKKEPRDLELAEGGGGDEPPSKRAEVTFEKDGTKINMPGWIAAIVLVAAGPWLTLSALPQAFPDWMTLVVLLAQLAATAYMAWAVKRR